MTINPYLQRFDDLLRNAENGPCKLKVIELRDKRWLFATGYGYLVWSGSDFRRLRRRDLRGVDPENLEAALIRASQVAGVPELEWRRRPLGPFRPPGPGPNPDRL